MLDIRTLSEGDTFYFSHRNYWLYTLQILEFIENNKAICLKKANEPFQQDEKDFFDVMNEEYFSSYEEALCYYNHWRDKKINELKDLGNLLDNLYSYAENEIPLNEIPLYQNAIKRIKERD